MPRHRPTFLPRHLQACAVLGACLAAAALATPADAGFGDLVKKAKEKAAKAVTPKAAPEATPAAAVDQGELVFDDVILELNGERIEKILAAYDAVREVSAGRPAIVEKLQKPNAEREAVLGKHWPAIDEQRRKRGDVEVCYQDGYQHAQDRRTEEYKDKALTDPTIREKFARVAAEHNEAAARGDSVAIRKIQEVLHQAVSPTREDSIQVRQSCGPLPARLPAEDRLDALEKEIAGLEAQLRAIDQKVAAAQSKQGGLTEWQWAMALERIHMFLAWKQTQPTGSSSGGSSGSAGSSAGSGESSASSPARPLFSDTEIAALEKHFVRLRATLG